MGGERAPAASPQRDDRLVECVAGAFPIRSTLYAASEGFRWGWRALTEAGSGRDGHWDSCDEKGSLLPGRSGLGTLTVRPRERLALAFL